MNANIRSSECAWQHASVTILGRTITGLRGWELKKESEKEHLYGAGNEPIDIQEGNRKYSGNIKVLGFEADALNKTAIAAGYSDITEVPHESITITIVMQKLKSDPKVQIVASGVSFSEDGDAMEQGAKMREITLPFLAMGRQKKLL